MMLFDDEQRKAIIYCGIAFFAGYDRDWETKFIFNP